MAIIILVCGSQHKTIKHIKSQYQIDEIKHMDIMLDDLKPEVQEEVRKFLRIKDKSNDDNYDTFPLFVLDEPETDDEEEKVLCGNCSREVDPETGIISEGKNRCERCKDI